MSEYKHILQQELDSVSAEDAAFLEKTASAAWLAAVGSAGLTAGYMGGRQMYNNPQTEDKKKEIEATNIRNMLLTGALGAGAAWLGKPYIKGFFSPKLERSTDLSKDIFDDIWKKRKS